MSPSISLQRKGRRAVRMKYDGKIKHDDVNDEHQDDGGKPIEEYDAEEL